MPDDLDRAKGRRAQHAQPPGLLQNTWRRARYCAAANTSRPGPADPLARITDARPYKGSHAVPLLGTRR